MNKYPELVEILNSYHIAPLDNLQQQAQLEEEVLRCGYIHTCLLLYRLGVLLFRCSREREREREKCFFALFSDFFCLKKNMTLLSGPAAAFFLPIAN